MLWRPAAHGNRCQARKDGIGSSNRSEELVAGLRFRVQTWVTKQTRELFVRAKACNCVMREISGEMKQRIHALGEGKGKEQ